MARSAGYDPVIRLELVGDAVGLSGAPTFDSLPFWGWMLGAVGALLAIPPSLVVKPVLVEVDRRSGWLDALLSGDSGSGIHAAGAPSESS